MPELALPEPFPASKSVPKWYKDIPLVAANELTIKKCVPFLDAFTAGYMIPLPVDVEFDKKSQSWSSGAGLNPISQHLLEQIQPGEFDPALDTTPWKFNNNWYVKTPKGYSTLFIHPVNRTDLPFHALTGIVDTDRHPVIINFPFLVKEGFEGVIPAGTPMIQAIPFKRDAWEMSVRDIKDVERQERFAWEIMNPPYGWYKRNWWVKKTFN